MSQTQCRLHAELVTTKGASILCTRVVPIPYPCPYHLYRAHVNNVSYEPVLVEMGVSEFLVNSVSDGVKDFC